MVRPKMRWRLGAVVLLMVAAAAEAVVNSGASDKDGPPGLIEIKGAEDLVAEASGESAGDQPIDRILTAESSHPCDFSVETQKREIPSGGLSNSYGEPIPADSYGPPPINDGGHSAQLILHGHAGVSDSYGPPSKPDLGLPVPVYGVPDDPSNHVKYPELPPDTPPPISGGSHQGFGVPHENYGPPKVNFAHIHHSGRPEIANGHKITVSGSQQYHGPPPPPQYGPPKIQYGPPKHGPPKPQYGPPKLQYGPPKQIFTGNKPVFNPPKPQYGPPKPQYGPPKQHFGPPPKIQYGPPKIQYGPPKHQFPPRPEYGPPKIQFAQKPAFLQKPHPVYGPPISHFDNNQVLKPLFPIPEDTYGPPGRPITTGDQFSHQISSEPIQGPPIGIHHGPPQPDPDPKPAHPGIPAPPTPPHILYDGWTPIPGLVSKPPNGHNGHNGHIGHIGHIGQISQIGQIGHIQDNYGPPPPPPHGEGSFISTLHSTGGGISSSGISGSYGVPAATYGVPVQSLNVHSIGGGDQSFISSGYSSVAANEGLQGIDLNSIIGASHGNEGIGLQGSKTVFEAHYTEGGHSHGIESAPQISSTSFINEGNHGSEVSVLQSLGFDISSIEGSSGSHSSSNIRVPFSSDGPYPGRQLSSAFPSSDIGLKPPSGIYGVPPGGKYGIPPPPPPHNSFKPHHLSISYGAPSGSVGTGSIHPLGVSPPKRPISFREPVPQGLIENIGQSVVQKDIFGVDSHSHNQHTYLPPPVQELPQKEPSQFFGGNDHRSHGSGSTFSVQASIEPSNLYSLPSIGNPINFHSGQSGPSAYSSSLDSYHAPLSGGDSFGSHSIQSSITSTIDGEQVAESSKDSEDQSIGTDAQSLAAAILKNCPYHKALYEAAKNVEQNSGSNSDSNSDSSSNQFKVLPSGSVSFNDGAIVVSNTRPPSSDLNSIADSDKDNQKGKSLNSIEENQNNVISTSGQDQSFEQFQSVALRQAQEQVQHQDFLGQRFEVLNGIHNIPIQGNLGSYTLQIQSADGLGHRPEPDVVPHEQVLSEGLLQSILQAIEQPHQTQIVPQPASAPGIQFHQSGFVDLNHASSGLVLPEGYEIHPRVVEMKEHNEQFNRADQEPDDDSEAAGSEPKPVIIVGPQNSEKITKSFLEQFGLSPTNEEKEPEIVTPLNIIDDNEIAVYFNSNKNDVNYDYDSENKDRNEINKSGEEPSDDDETTEMVTEISIETSISASEDESQKNAQQYGDEASLSKKGKFGDRIIKKVDPKADEVA